MRVYVVKIVDIVLHIPVSLLHIYSNTLDTVFHVNTCYTGHCHFMSLFHYYIDTVTLDIIIPWSCTTGTRTRCYMGCCYTDTVISYHRYLDSPTYMFWLFLSSYCLHHCSCYNIYQYINIHVLLWHEYLIQYMTVSCIPNFGYDIPVTEHVNCWYAMYGAKSHISYFLCLVILFNDINIAHVLLSRYMYHTLLLFLIYCVV